MLLLSVGKLYRSVKDPFHSRAQNELEWSVTKLVRF